MNHLVYVRQVILLLTDYGPLCNVVPKQATNQLVYVCQTTLDRLRSSHSVVLEQAIRVSLETLSLPYSFTDSRGLYTPVTATPHTLYLFADP